MKRTLRLAFVLTLATAPLAAFAAEAKKVIVCSVTTGFRHSSIGEAEKTLQKLANESKAFTIVDFVHQPDVQIPKKPSKPKEPKADADEKAKAKYAGELKKYDEEMAKWTPEKDAEVKKAEDTLKEQLKANMAKLAPANLAKVDAVIFANTTGDDFPLPDRDGFFKWIKDGGAFIGMHSATDTFKQYEPYYDMLQGTFSGHGAQVPADILVADPKHPATAGLPNPWNLAQEEMYHIKNHDRSKLHALLYMSHDPNDATKTGYFPVSWCRMDGKGRVFYTSLGHREDLWSDDPNMKDRKNSVETSKLFQQHVLGGIKWALGLAEGSAAPNPEAK